MRSSSSEYGVHEGVNDLRVGDVWESTQGPKTHRAEVLCSAFLWGGSWWVAIKRSYVIGPELTRAIPFLDAGRRIS